MEEIFGHAHAFLVDYWVLVPVAGGLVMLLAAIFDWRFFVDPEGPNAGGFLNWIHRDFGRGPYRVMLGAVSLLLMVSCVAYWLLLRH